MRVHGARTADAAGPEARVVDRPPGAVEGLAIAVLRPGARLDEVERGERRLAAPRCRRWRRRKAEAVDGEGLRIEMLARRRAAVRRASPTRRNRRDRDRRAGRAESASACAACSSAVASPSACQAEDMVQSSRATNTVDLAPARIARAVIRHRRDMAAMLAVDQARTRTAAARPRARHGPSARG